MKPQTTDTFYKSLFDNMPDGLAYCQVLFDKEGNMEDYIYLEVNKSFEQLTGLKNVVGKRVTEMIPSIKESNPELFEVYSRVSLTGISEKFETYIDLLTKWFSISVYCPKRFYFIAIFQNITDRKQTEKELENARVAAQNVFEDLSIEKSKVDLARAKEEALLMSIGDGLVATDKKGNIVLVNKTAETLLNIKSEEVLGEAITDIITTKDERGVLIPPEKHPIRTALTNGVSTVTTTSGTTYYYTSRDNALIPVSIMVTPVILDKKVIGAIEVFRDITREKEVDKAKSEFISIASHQLNTPLGITKWTIEALKLNKPIWAKTPKIVLGALEQVYQSNERLIYLVDSLLSITRVENKRLNSTKTKVNLVDIISSVIFDMRKEAGRKSLTIKFSPPRLSVLIAIKSDQFYTVMQNLLSNAIKYNKNKGNIGVNILLGRDNIKISVTDTGIGISKKDTSSLFQKFFRAQNAQLHDSKGSGLGLYIAKAYIEGWGGKITFSSQEGKGSVFTISIPLNIK